MHLHLGYKVDTRQYPPSEGDITSKEASLVDVGALCGLLGHLEARLMFCTMVEASPCQFLQAGPSSYSERWLAAFDKHVWSECLPSSWPLKKGCL